MNLECFALFTDVSLNPQRRSGVGGYLLVPLSFLNCEAQAIEQSEVSARLKIKWFAETSSTKLELQTLLWALSDAQEMFQGVTFESLRVYTDSQCITGLVSRRSGLASSDFIAKRSGKPLANALIYREFYEAYDRLGFQLYKVAGHSPTGSHDTVQRVFSYVDREVRKALARQNGVVQTGLH